MVFLWTLNEFLHGSLRELISGILAVLIFLLVGVAIFISGWKVGIGALVSAFALGNLLRPPALALARHLIVYPDQALADYGHQRGEQTMTDLGSEGYLAQGQMLRLHAEAIGQVLREYIAVHDAIFGGGFLRALRRSVPIPGFFQVIDFEAHEKTLGALASRLKLVRTDLDTLAGPRAIVQLVRDYCYALEDTVGRLELMCRRLASRKLSPDSYTRPEYDHDLQEYERSVAEYQLLGDQLNRAFRARIN